ncbi:hypothetical protein DE146DRAFT_137419 [Phaeosphaeria sp. MPI-PUGE-AT-0046c]|nr:hypothetical protein DE146DRAFT_137419 [Phaeosphaeria sp. MPI-PUGE-AT-0046c]
MSWWLFLRHTWLCQAFSCEMLDSETAGLVRAWDFSNFSPTPGRTSEHASSRRGLCSLAVCLFVFHPCVVCSVGGVTFLTGCLQTVQEADSRSQFQGETTSNHRLSLDLTEACFTPVQLPWVPLGRATVSPMKWGPGTHPDSGRACDWASAGRCSLAMMSLDSLSAKRSPRGTRPWA